MKIGGVLMGHRSDLHSNYGSSILPTSTKFKERVMVTFRNLYLGLKDQLPFKRFFKNFFVTRNAWGLFHKNSHISYGSGKPKVMYNTKKTAEKSAEAMGKKHNCYFSNYKCIYCDGYHIGRNRD